MVRPLTNGSNGDNNHDGSGTLSAAGRFVRIAAALTRIEDKLDAKADVNEMKILAALVDKNRSEIAESRGARDDWMARGARITALEKAEAERSTAAKVLADASVVAASNLRLVSDARYRVIQFTVGFLGIVQLGVVIFVAIKNLLP